MKKKWKGLLVALLAVALVFGLSSCGGGNSPQSLARQLWDHMAVLNTIDFSDSAAMEAYGKKSAELEAKIDKLSEADRRIFDEEIQRLEANR